ncbi:DUF1788 domain-containing protein [Escherichia coli]|uniref:DUF1788 domain-containing protein n=1 Tax=Plesiomonas TaxID=702 RepID=UPI001F2E4CFD|nr:MULTISPECIES: DUF1788 domain-containing protein [Plesiomonas]EGK3607992.1 DUF1788 domain-containing protein [Escherichia coli]MCE5164309.1 DUF1788 domain-containing protein [Plesiomonas sp. PI-19]MCX2534796.1 DUF1788 domain-containing protein [Plesiomonas shigelloides]
MSVRWDSEAQLKTRLEQVAARLQRDSFLNNQELGGEIGFYIFDYPPQFELVVREYLESSLLQVRKQGLRFLHLNLFEELLDLLQERKLLDKAFELERKKGTEELAKALKGPLEQGRVAKHLMSKIHPANPQFVLLSGLGQCWPLLRGHSLLNALHAHMGAIPLVLFYPGRYNGLELYPFDLDRAEVATANYYRAFQLVPHGSKY